MSEIITATPVPVVEAPAELADLDAVAERIRRRLKRAAQDVIDTGRDLIEVRARLPHGRFLAWVEAEFGWSDQTARRFIHVAERFGHIQTQQIVEFAPSALYLLAAPSAPDEAREEALSRAEAGEPITHAVAQQLLAARPARRPATPGMAAGRPPVTEASGERFRVEQADALDWFARQEADSLDLVLGSPQYAEARLYLEGGRDLGIAKTPDEWVAWMVEVVEAALRCCKGLVAFVVDGQTENYRWNATPARLMAKLDERGVCLRRPPVYCRNSTPGSGNPDWLRNCYEWVVCATRVRGPLPWHDNTAMGEAPKYAPGGDLSYRRRDGSRVNGEGGGYATPEDRGNVGPHRARVQAGAVYVPPEKANPGNVIWCKVGGGNMGDALCHENEAPFPEYLAEFFVRSFCAPGGVVADPFCGSGTTGAMALASGRRFVGCDLRASQVALTMERLAKVALGG